MKKLSVLLLLLTSLLSGITEARPFWGQGEHHAQRQQERFETRRHGKSLDEAVEQVRRRTGGRILNAQTVKQNGTRIHRIKVLTPDNRVRILRIEADE